MCNMNNITITSEPFCWTSSGIFSFLGPAFTIVSVIPYAIPFINTLLVCKKTSVLSIYLMIYMKVITCIAHITQGVIKWKRPYPECIPSILVDNGFPEPGLVYLWSSALTNVFLYYFDYDSGAVTVATADADAVSNHKAQQFVKKKIKYNSIKKITVRIKRHLRLLCQLIFYMIVYRMAYLASTPQILLSIVYSTIVMGSMFYFLVFNKNAKFI